MSGSDLVVRCGLLFFRRGGLGRLAGGGEQIGVGRCRRIVSLTVPARIEPSLESLAHGRGWWRRRVAPAEGKTSLVLPAAWPIGRGCGGRASGDVSGQPLGLIPLIGGRGACRFGVVKMQAADGGELWWLVRSASSSRARCGIHGGGEYVSINDVG